MDLSECRREIDKIDNELVKLFEKRMNISVKVAEYKIANNMAIFNEAREQEVIDKNTEKLSNPQYSHLVKKFFTHLMKLSRELQGDLISANEVKKEEENIKSYDNNIRIGYPGVKGSFSEEAMIKFFGEGNISYNFQEFEEVFIALKNNEIDYGILPIENSYTGAITNVYDLLVKYGFYIVGEECIKINQNLVGIKGATVDDVKLAYSHPQGFEQSRKFFNEHNNIDLIPFHNTAIGAKYVSEVNDKSKAAVASLRAAELYGLDVIKKEINDKDDNHTKFIVIGRNLETTAESNKVTVVFSLDDNVGTLYNLLRHFAENNINMMKIESRPSKDEPWQYLLYVDFQGNLDDKDVNNAIKIIDEKSEYFKLLGCYKKMTKECLSSEK